MSGRGVYHHANDLQVLFSSVSKIKLNIIVVLLNSECMSIYDILVFWQKNESGHLFFHSKIKYSTAHAFLEMIYNRI